ncbi:serine/threonine protein kinase [Salininema proteolyticum]|uniref:Serine/threonine protein kinase n=1 Tax=Salininema proteolyticum TaxID=1607685 RepID=A0ABV8U4A0_9ACTN
MRRREEGDPRTLGGYRIFAELGRGGMGRVLLAGAENGALVALKVVHPHLLDEPQFRERFRREVRASRRVAAGVHTAAVVDDGVDDDIPWFATEFFYGPTLGEALEKSGGLDERPLRHLAAGLASALDHVHGEGLVHRDLKPSNIILASSGVKVIDFGIARATDTVRETTLTGTGFLIGVPSCMAPEQVQGRTAAPASDVFSLGTMLLTAASGTNPYEREGPFPTLNAVVNERPDFGVLPAGLREAVEACQEKDPADRPRTSELAALIGAVAPTADPWPRSVRRQAARQKSAVADIVAKAGFAVDDGPTGPFFSAGRVGAEEPETVREERVPPTRVDPQAQSGPEPANDENQEDDENGEKEDVRTSSDMDGAGPAPGRDTTAAKVVAGVIGALLLVIGLVNSADGGGGGGEDDSSGAEETTSSEEKEADPYDGRPDTDTEQDSDDRETTRSPEPDPYRDAAVGDCFDNEGTETSPDLVSVSCGSGYLEVIDYHDGTTDLSRCSGDELDYSVSLSAYDRVLCLTYLGKDAAYHARTGDCVWQPDDGDWVVASSCVTGTFEVVERIEGTADGDACTDDRWLHWMRWYETAYGFLDRTLCLKFVYPDDAGYAKVNECLRIDGNYFYFDDCDRADAYVTGRTSGVDKGFCGDHGSTWWESNTVSDFSYTVCWRYL